MTDDETTLLEQSRPSFDRDRLATASADLARRIAAGSPARRRPRTRVAVGVVAALIAVPTAAAATGALDGLRTGLFGQPDRYSEDAGTSEWIDICSPAYPDLIRQHTPASDLPAGFTWHGATEKQVAQTAANPACGAGAPGARQQEIGIDAWFARYATCAWYAEASAADAAGDVPRVARAGKALKALANTELNHTIDGGGIVAWDNRIADGVLAGDVSEARSVAQDCELIQ